MSPKEFEHIIPTLRPLMLKVGRDFFGNQADADDVAQESLLRLWKYCERLNAGRNIKALAVKTAKNVCVEMYERERKQPKDLHADTIVLEAGVGAEDRLEAEETQQKLQEAIERLSPRERELFRKRHLDGLTAEEIAHETGIPKASVKSMISMAKRKISEELQNFLRR